jgi:hypothetical protein
MVTVTELQHFFIHKYNLIQHISNLCWGCSDSSGELPFIMAAAKRSIDAGR